MLLAHVLVVVDGSGLPGSSLVEDVELLGRRVLLEKLAGHFSLGSKDNTVACENAESGAGV